MPSQAPTCVLQAMPLTRARLRASDCHVDQDAAGGPMRTRRRLTRAQRRPQERRSERRSGNWLQGPYQRPAAAAAAAPPQLPREPPRVPQDSDSDVDAHDAASGAGAGRSPQLRQVDCSDDERRACSPLDARHLGGGAGAVPNSFCDPGSPASPSGPPAHLPAHLALLPSAAAGATTKDALQQRLMLLRRRDGLIDITIRTMKLMRRNQQLQHRLMALQAETRAFVRSVLSNPENRGLRLPRAAAAALASPVASRPESPSAPSSAASSAPSSPASTSPSSDSSPATSPAPRSPACTPSSC